MKLESLKGNIEKYFENIKDISTKSDTLIINDIGDVLELLDSGKIRICEKVSGEWVVNQWIKKAILLSFKIRDNKIFNSNNYSYSTKHNSASYSLPDQISDKIFGDERYMNNIKFFDKIPLKFENWEEKDFQEAAIRVVPGAIARYSSFIGKNVVLMPSFVNIGAYIDSGTMIDTWATVGSCAQIGKNCHVSGGAGIGGVLEPLQSNPVIIEDNCFIGARSEIAEGVIVEEGSVISMGVYIGASTKIIDRNTGEIFYGRVPKYSVVVPGNVKNKNNEDLSLYAAIIVKRVDEKTRSKTSINELLRDK